MYQRERSSRVKSRISRTALCSKYPLMASSTDFTTDWALERIHLSSSRRASLTESRLTCMGSKLSSAMYGSGNLKTFQRMLIERWMVSTSSRLNLRSSQGALEEST
ncbi:hypothetical protein DSECCO2_546130 [anaerobic digester metagenome]